jgi:DNA-binding response OmpR family regulator
VTLSLSKTCLVVLAEDLDLVAEDVDATVGSGGYAVVGPFSTCAAAMSWLADSTPDIAVLSRVLQDGTCESLAAELKVRGVPFLIFSPRVKRN